LLRPLEELDFVDAVDLVNEVGTVNEVGRFLRSRGRLRSMTSKIARRLHSADGKGEVKRAWE